MACRTATLIRFYVAAVELAALGLEPRPVDDQANRVEADLGDLSEVLALQRNLRGEGRVGLVVLAEADHVDAAQQDLSSIGVEDSGVGASGRVEGERSLGVGALDCGGGGIGTGGEARSPTQPRGQPKGPEPKRISTGSASAWTIELPPHPRATTPPARWSPQLALRKLDFMHRKSQRLGRCSVTKV